MMITPTIWAPARHLARAEAVQVAERCAHLLVSQFGAKRVIPFGSVTGVSPWHSRSDIDLAVQGIAPRHFFKAWAALDECLPPGAFVEIDLIDLDEVPPTLRAMILGEIQMPKNKHAALKLEIENELQNLERVVKKVGGYSGPAPEPDEVAIAGIAKYLHDFYNGLESVFERITVRLEGGLPPGAQWHITLLDRMANPIPDIRPAVIDEQLHQRLLKFLRFRHRVRHVYSYDLDWSQMKERVDELEDVLEKVEAALKSFGQWLEEKSQVADDKS